MLPEQSVDGSAQVLHVPHNTYQMVERIGLWLCVNYYP